MKRWHLMVYTRPFLDRKLSDFLSLHKRNCTCMMKLQFTWNYNLHGIGNYIEMEFTWNWNLHRIGIHMVLFKNTKDQVPWAATFLGPSCEQDRRRCKKRTECTIRGIHRYRVSMLWEKMNCSVGQWVKFFVLHSALKISRMNDTDKQTKLCL